LLKLIKVVSENNSIKINLYFEDEKLDESIAFIDFYIDLNNECLWSGRYVVA
jgi:hypothetical protein